MVMTRSIILLEGGGVGKSKKVSLAVEESIRDRIAEIAQKAGVPMQVASDYLLKDALDAFDKEALQRAQPELSL